MNLYNRVVLSKMAPVMTLIDKSMNPEQRRPKPPAPSPAVQMLVDMIRSKTKARPSKAARKLADMIRGKPKTKEVPPGATTWVEADAAAAAAKVQATTDDFAALIENVLHDPNVTDKAGVVRTLAAEYEQRIGSQLPKGRTGKKTKDLTAKGIGGVGSAPTPRGLGGLHFESTADAARFAGFDALLRRLLLALGNDAETLRRLVFDPENDTLLRRLLLANENDVPALRQRLADILGGGGK